MPVARARVPVALARAGAVRTAWPPDLRAHRGALASAGYAFAHPIGATDIAASDSCADLGYRAGLSELPQPSRIGERYELQDKLGAGASGDVYRAFDQKLGREIAIKLMKETPQGDALRRFVREARVASQFRHPDVIEIFDVGELEGRPFLVMELVTSPTLATAIESAPEPPTVATTIEISATIASMLAAAHEAGLVHRDLKPSNVFVEGPLEAPQRCRLADFGLAFMVEPSSETMGRFTTEGVILGTPFYIAPEQAAGGAVGPSADVYSLGCMIHEMISGRPPFVGNLARIIAGHLYLPPIALRELVPDVPSALEQLVLEMLDKSPSARPPARDIAPRLRQLSAAANQRSAPLQPRLARAIAPHRAQPLEADQDRVEVAVEIDDPALVTSLRAAQIAIATTAPLVIVSFEALQQPDDDGRSRLALHPAPSANELSLAIRLGAVGVARWPGPIAALVAQIHKTWRRIRTPRPLGGGRRVDAAARRGRARAGERGSTRRRRRRREAASGGEDARNVRDGRTLRGFLRQHRRDQLVEFG